MVVFWIRQRDFFQSENSEKGGSILSVSMCVCALWTCIIENLPFYKVRQSKQWKKQLSQITDILIAIIWVYTIITSILLLA